MLVSFGRLFRAAAALSAVALSLSTVFAVPQGQITVAPGNPAWLVRQGAGPLFICGPGDPEDFLYRGTRNADGTRTGDQMTLINKLKATGANSIYMQIIRSHGGDGSSDHNPFIGSDSAAGLDEDILNQWETWFTAMDNAGIVIFLFFYDDGACVWDCSSSSVPTAERNFINGIVAHFKHHKNLIWVHAEEYSEAFETARASAFAAAVRAADDNQHVIAEHQLPGLSFDLANDPNVDQFAIQYNSTGVSTLHNAMVTAWNNAAGRYNINMSEIAEGGLGTDTTTRARIWAMAMGGAYVMANGWKIADTPVARLNECGWMVEFMENSKIHEMAPHDELKFGGTQYVLAKPGSAYIAYALGLTGEIGLKGMTAGAYSFHWLDVATGVTVDQLAVQVTAGDRSWPKPSGIGSEVAVYVRLVAGTDTQPPATPTNLNRTDKR